MSSHPCSVKRKLGPRRYKMEADPLGFCLIINNKTFQTDDETPQLPVRRGTDTDKDKLVRTFTNLRFDVRAFDNLTDTGIMRIMTQFALRDHTNFDCFVCCILSHGIQGGVYGSNCIPVEIRKLIERFCPQSCPTLSGKPKLFFIQACQGTQLQRGYPSAELDSVLSEDKLIPSLADFLLAYSTVPGYMSCRDQHAGSYFISKLTSVLKNHAHSLDIMKILTMVNDQLSCLSIPTAMRGHCKQCSAQFTTLRKDLYLFSDERSVSPVELKSGVMQIFVRLPNNKYITLMVARKTTTIDLKQLVEEKDGTPPEYQRLIYGGRQLEDDTRLTDYGVTDESTINMVMRLKGGEM